MSNTAQHPLIAEIARDIVNQIAPHELPLFRATSEAYFRRATRSLKGQGARDELLGFGTGKEVSFVTPIALAVTDAVVAFVAAHVGPTASAGRAAAGELVRSVFRKYRSIQPADQQAPPLTGAQVAQARQLAFQKARQLNLADAQAGILADFLVGSLASATS